MRSLVRSIASYHIELIQPLAITMYRKRGKEKPIFTDAATQLAKQSDIQPEEKESDSETESSSFLTDLAILRAIQLE